MTKDLSLTVPFSPAMVFGPSMSKGDRMAAPSVSSSRAQGLPQRQGLTLESGIPSEGGTDGNASPDSGDSSSRNSREGPSYTRQYPCALRASADIPEDREAARRPVESVRARLNEGSMDAYLVEWSWRTFWWTFDVDYDMNKNERNSR